MNKLIRIFVPIFTITIVSVSSLYTQVLEQDSLALVALYNSTDGDNWNNNTNWLSASPVYTWHGVGPGTLEGKRVASLNLSSNGLDGSIPPEIGNLTNLAKLYLRTNNLRGTIPPEIGYLTNLRKLDLEANNLNGAIPAEIGSLTNLQELDLQANNLNGSIPPEIGYLGDLEILNLSDNDLNGVIPPEIRDLKNLEELDLHLNQLSGSIPPEIGYLELLELISLGENNLNGTIPPEIGNFIYLTELNLSYNQLTGSIPPEIQYLTELNSLFLSNNQFRGSIPPVINCLTNLRTLELQTNQLSGAVPEEIKYLPNLESLHLQDNQFTDLPCLLSMPSLIWLDVKENRFTFEDIQYNIGICDNFTYSPQAKVGDTKDLTYAVGSTGTFSVTVGGTANQYQWFKDDVAITGATGTNYTINNLDTDDTGSYTCQITNTIATNLTLESHPKNLTVVPYSLTLTSPNGGEKLEHGKIHPITWDATDNSGTVSLELYKYFDTGITIIPITSSIENDGSYDWTVPGWSSTTCKIGIHHNEIIGCGDASDNFFTLSSESQIPVILTPALSVNTITLDFGTSATSLTLDISNSGTGTLTWQVSENPDKSWITSVTPSSGTNNGTVTITVDRNNLSENSDSGTLTVSSNGGTQNIVVTIAKSVSTAPRAVRFAASGDYIEVPHSNSIAPSEFTIEFWLRVNALGDPQLADGEQTIIDKRGENDTGYNFRLAGTAFPIDFYAFAGTENVNTGGIYPSVWYHIAVTQDNNTLKLYLDGELMMSTANIYPAATTAPLRIGEFLGYPDTYLGLRGDIDEMRIWNYARNQSDIQATMDQELSGSEAGLAAYWDFNNQAGGMIPDLTANGNHGIIHGNATLIEQETTSVENDINTAIPQQFTLWQNYPNPFNPTTTIRYALHQPATVRLMVYNLKGQRVKQLVAHNDSPGLYHIVWDGTDDSRQSVAGGIYIYTIHAGNDQQSRKMVLLR